MHLRIVVSLLPLEAFSTFFQVIQITLAEQFISLQYLLTVVHIQFLSYSVSIIFKCTRLLLRVFCRLSGNITGQQR